MLLVESFVLPNFNYCPIIWHFCCAKDQHKKQHKMEKVQQRTLRFVYADYSSTYSELLCKAESCTLELRRIRMTCTEISKTLNHMAQVYMNNLIIPKHSKYSTRRPLNLFVPRVNQTTYGCAAFAIRAPYYGTVCRKKSKQF